MTLISTGVLRAVLSTLILASVRGQQDGLLWCFLEDGDNQGMPIPKLPESYSMNIQLNFESKSYSSEITRLFDGKLNRSSIEIWERKRHVKYISLQKEQIFITLDFKETGTTCATSSVTPPNYNVLDKVIFNALLGLERKITTSGNQFIYAGLGNMKGIYVRQWESCIFLDEINNAVQAVVTFADNSWTPSHPVYVNPAPDEVLIGEIVQIEMKIPGKLMDIEEFSSTVILDFNRYLPFPPADEDFQLPEDVHCSNLRSDVKPPDLPSYFSYNAEVILHRDSADIAPVVFHRTVYYDYSQQLTRIDAQEPFTDNSQPNATLRSQLATVIRDFKAGIEYIIDPQTGKCDVTASDDAFDVVTSKTLSTSLMLDPKKYFIIDGAQVSYLGQYTTRGLKTDVFSSLINVEDESHIFRWYFTTDKVQMMEEKEIQNNVLVKLVTTPVSASNKIGTLEINFYNFVDEEPSAFIYDVSSCYNETLSKTFVLSFPSVLNPFMQQLTVLIRQRMHTAIAELLGINKQRVAVQQVILKSAFLSVQMKILDIPPVGTVESTEISLNQAIAKLKDSVAQGTFTVTLNLEDKSVVIMQPHPNGLREYSPGEVVQVVENGFASSSVAGLAFGMIILGLLMGGLAVNILITRKHGVSLFQSSGMGSSGFENPLDESSI